MTMIDVDTSPLQAAREWRGIGLVAAAMHSGLPMAQAEALEEGDPSAFGSIDEMIAAAIVYGASIGVGRDEAVALLDRTVSGTGTQVELPDAPVEAESSSFSGAVRSRSARIADRAATQQASEAIVVEPIQPEGAADAPVPDVAASSVLDAPVPPAELAIELPDVPGGPTPEQAMAASSEIYVGDAFAPMAPWERGDGNTGELEAWVDGLEPQRAGETGGGAAVRRRSGGGFGRGVHALTERVVGTDKADAAAEWVHGVGDRVHEWTRIGREKLRRSEHATLIVAIGGGAVLIALLVAIGGALGGGDDDAAGPGPAKREPAASTTVDAGAAGGDATGAATKAEATAATKAAAVAPLISPARLTVDVYNAGSQKGVAKDVAAKLTAAGYGIGEVGNAKEDYATARVIHPKDMAREARLIAKRTGITTLQVAPGSTRKITVVTGI